ncbi:MAG: M23 family metallopeptidase [Nitriliruptoraceae bacterium]
MRRRWFQRPVMRFATVLPLTVVVLLWPQIAAAQVLLYTSPVEYSVVLRGFDPPDATWGSGHRGVDFAAPDSAVIRAAADGMVTFAGPVVTHVWASIAHADGHLSTYGPLTALRVQPGDMVTRGTVIGRLAAGGHGAGNADHGLHFSLRHNGDYIDPFSVLPAGGLVTLVGESMWMAGGAPPRAQSNWGGGRLGGLLVQSSRKTTLPYAYYPPNANHLLLVGGLATSSDSDLPDPALLGYAADSVTRFSYAGLDQPYQPEHTWDGPLAYVDLFEETLRDIALRQPGRAVDLVVHSQGGLIIVAYLASRNALTDPTLPPIGNVVMFGVPMSGSDLAALGVLIRDEMGLSTPIDALQRFTGLGTDTLRLDAPAIRELDPRSDAIRSLSDAWKEAWNSAFDELPHGPLVLRPNVLSVAGAHDLVVAPGRTRITSGQMPEDAQAFLHERVLPGGHGSMKHTAAANETMWRFLAGEEIVESDGYLARAVGATFGGLISAARFALSDLMVPRHPSATGCFGVNRLLSRC